MPNRRLDVIVVGAGAAGLAAAETLSRAGASVLVLEAQARAGGRILTRRPRGWPIPIEHGAEFVHGRSDEIFQIADEAGLLIDRLPNVHAQVSASGWRPARGFWAQYEAITRQMGRSGRDRSVAEFLASRRRMPGADRQLLVSIVEGYHAAPLDRASEHALSTAGEPRSLADRAQFRVVSGYGGVTRWLRSRIDPKRCRLLFSSAVREIQWRRGEATVRTASVGDFRARHAIITVSAGVLKARPGARGSIRFDPDPLTHRRALETIEMGHVVKIVLRFQRAFWETARARLQSERWAGEEIAFLHRRDATFPTLWTAAPAQVPMLTRWAGGPAADALMHLPAKTVLTHALETVGSFFEIRSERVRRLLLAWHMHDWSADPFTRGAYSYQAVGGASAPTALARPVEETLFFAGEATEREQNGTVPGAIASGRRAASHILG